MSATVASLLGGGIPERMGPLNTVMNLLPADKRDALFILYMNATS